MARVVGIDVEREKVKLFTLMGALAGLAAIFLTLENKNYFDQPGAGLLLIVIASVFIGGTSIFGGSGTIVGSYIGSSSSSCMRERHGRDRTGRLASRTW